jgi:rubredoxin-NAD+ reductase
MMNLSAAVSAPESVPAFRKWTCAVCDYVYDEALGDPDHGLALGTRYEAIPDDWNCPDCGVTKADFYCFDD